MPHMHSVVFGKNKFFSFFFSCPSLFWRDRQKGFPECVAGSGTTASHGASLPLLADKMVVHPSSAVTAHTHHEIRISMSVSVSVRLFVCSYIRV